jgi:hypothetical protein
MPVFVPPEAKCSDSTFSTSLTPLHLPQFTRAKKQDRLQQPDISELGLTTTSGIPMKPASSLPEEEHELVHHSDEEGALLGLAQCTTERNLRNTHNRQP